MQQIWKNVETLFMLPGSSGASLPWSCYMTLHLYISNNPCGSHSITPNPHRFIALFLSSFACDNFSQNKRITYKIHFGRIESNSFVFQRIHAILWWCPDNFFFVTFLIKTLGNILSQHIVDNVFPLQPLKLKMGVLVVLLVENIYKLGNTPLH